MSDPSLSPSVPETADAVDLASPEGAAVPTEDAGDAFAQAVGGAAPADEATGSGGPAVDPVDADGAATAQAAEGATDPAAGGATAPAEQAPPPHGAGDVAVDDLAPALHAAGIGVDGTPAPEEAVVTPGATAEAPGGKAPAATGEAARSGKALDATLGVVRLGVGVALVAAPRWAGRIWVGPGADGPGSLVFARAVGARDVALGLRILAGVRTGEPVRHWVAAGFAADAADVAATLIAGRHLTPERRVAMPLIAGAVGALGIWSGRRSRA